ncbi:hypothetical protein AB0L32_10685 [Micrococcus luteus]|uniref:hypothetical protein n=1 Tax=Micrococcus luteus TaxID=1270 RepID=UPI00343F1FD6
MASVTSLASTLQQQLADALTAALPEAGTADPLLRRSDRADFQANGILALAKKLKGNPRELASQVTAALPETGLIKAWTVMTMLLFVSGGGRGRRPPPRVRGRRRARRR